jgi:hypothetical protein
MLRIESGVWSVHGFNFWGASAGLFFDHSVFGEDTSVRAAVRCWPRLGAVSTGMNQIAGGTGIAVITRII